MTKPVRVVHVPGRTPYARKLVSAAFQGVNGVIAGGIDIPRDVTCRWLLTHKPWDWFDVVHLHHIEFEPIVLLKKLLWECRRARKRVVFTAHDLAPIFISTVEYNRRLRLLVSEGVPFVCLTERSCRDVRAKVAADCVVIPHGRDGAALPERPVRAAGPTRFLIFGSLRSSRDIELVLNCWRFAPSLGDSELRLLLRAPSRASMVSEESTWRTICMHAADTRLGVEVRSFPTDQEIRHALMHSDCLVLPYRWASHSGQLEAAADAGTLALASRIGYLADQAAMHHGLSAEPSWFDWADGNKYAYGERFLTAMEDAHARIQSGWQAPGPAQFSAHRDAEGAAILAAHGRLYGADEQ